MNLRRPWVDINFRSLSIPRAFRLDHKEAEHSEIPPLSPGASRCLSQNSIHDEFHAKTGILQPTRFSSLPDCRSILSMNNPRLLSRTSSEPSLGKLKDQASQQLLLEPPVENPHFVHCPGRVTLSEKRLWWAPWIVQKKIEAVDGRPYIPPVAEEALPVEVDDIVSAAAGHQHHPSALFTPLFAVAGVFAIVSTIFGVRTSLAAHKAIKNLKQQISKAKADLEGDAKERYQIFKGTLNTKEFSNLVKINERYRNTKAYIDERQETLKDQFYRRWSSALMSIGTGIQSVGILASGSMMGTVIGTTIAAPLILGFGLVTVGVFAGISIIDGAKKLHEVGKDIKELASKIQDLNPVTRTVLTNRLKRLKWVTVMGIVANGCLAVGAATIGAGMLGSLALPGGVAIPAVILVALGVVGLIAHHITHHRLTAYKPSHGPLKRHLGSITSIAKHLEFSKRHHHMLQDLRHQKGNAFAMLSRYLTKEARLRGELKPTSPHSYDFLRLWQPETNSHTIFERLKEYLHRHHLLGKTLNLLIAHHSRNPQFNQFIRRSPEGVWNVQLDDEANSGNVDQAVLAAFEEAFTNEALRVIVREESHYRNHEIRELSDHLILRLKAQMGGA